MFLNSCLRVLLWSTAVVKYFGNKNFKLTLMITLVVEYICPLEVQIVHQGNLMI